MRFIQYVLLPILSFAAMAGCQDRASTSASPSSGGPGTGARDSAEQSLPISDSLAQKAMYTYVGHQGEGLITMVINYISGDAVSGYSIQRGRRRNFNGGVQLRGTLLHFELEETGDQPEKFEIGLDTLGWKMTGRVARDGEWRQLEAARRPGTVPFEDLWVADMTNYHDSILTFNASGVCEFRFYQRPRDSTSQVITIKGNYERLAGIDKGFRVEWEENAHLSPLNARLVEKKHELTGCGLKLVYFVAPW